MRNRIAALIVCISFALGANAQNKYVYQVDLTQVKDDKLPVQLTTPKISKPSIVFHFPKMIPGTYRISDYGKFISEVKALDKNGNALPVKQLSVNSWQISNATKLSKVTYMVEDTWDSDIKNDIYPMSGTNIEEGKNFVVNTPGFFGYFEGMNRLPFELNFTKPSSFYAASPLTARSSTSSQDVFDLEDVDHLYDSPIMFSAPDTTTVHLGKTEVLIAVYSPKKMVQSKFIAQLMANVLQASSKYLGGKLPVEKYAFIFYFNGEQRQFTTPGALEHNYSSFYSLPEAPQNMLAPVIMDIAAHEFFHVVTPLTIRSREVKEFNFADPAFSKHLWLYEGSTEYASDHVQVKYGLNTVNQFLDKLSQKIKLSKENYNDTLPFTVLSKESAGKYRQQYPNVYEKGALIAACLDIYLLHLSAGTYDLTKLKHDLSIRYGKKTAFNDDELFNVIAELSYPEVRDFFRKYVEGNQAIPYDYFFGLAGIRYHPLYTRNDITLGSVSIAITGDGKVVVGDISKLDAFGKKLGYKKSDELLSINNIRLSPAELNQALAKVKSEMKEGSMLRVKAVRNKDTIELSAPVERVELKEFHKLEVLNNATMEQATVRRGWLAPQDKGVALQGDRNDVTEIDQIVKALYDVISGPPGPRNWEMFRSLFTAGAFMGATVPAQGGAKFVTFTPEEYIQKNAPLFLQSSFNEKEIGRTVHQFGNVAQVFTTYEFDLDNGKVKQRGINSVQLVREQGRWWIASIVWQEESKTLTIPSEYLK